MVSLRPAGGTRVSRNPRPPASAAVLFRDRQKAGGFATPQNNPLPRRHISDRRHLPSLHRSNAGGVQKAAPGEKKKVFGLDLPENESLSFLILAGGSLGSALGFAALQEGVFRIPGFKFGAWMTILTTFTYFLCGALEMKLTNDSRKASWKNYGILSVYTYGGMAMTNYALSYLNYATRIVFKSAKIIPVMAFSVLIVGKKYDWKEWLSAAILVAGIVLFTLGDVASSPAFAPIGVALIAGALCVDAICANFEEKNFFRCENPSTHPGGPLLRLPHRYLLRSHPLHRLRQG